MGLGPIIEPGPTLRGLVHGLVVGCVMTAAVWFVIDLLGDRGRRTSLSRKASNLDAVISGRRLHSIAQPIIDLTDGRVVGVEMLSRFDVEPVSPDPWFRAAAELGRLQELELIALGASLEAAADLPRSLFISINVSPVTLCAPELQAAIAWGGIDPRRVILELTEHHAIEDYLALQRALDSLKGMGVRLAVDDAGAGYSSFRHILNLKPQMIKVDRALVSDIHIDAGRRALAAAIVMFALEMDATVTAEGVETDEELQVLKSLGMDTAQGYLLGRPTRDRGEWASWQQLRSDAALQ